MAGASFSRHSQGGGIWPDGAGMPNPQRQAPPTNSAPEPATAGDLDLWPTSLALPLVPGGLVACHGVHRPPGSKGRADRPARQQERAHHDRGSRELRRQPRRPPELRHTEGGIARARFRVAISGRREQELSFFTVIVWRDQAEHATRSLAKGSRAMVIGRLQQRAWTAEDGTARSVVEVVAEELGPSLTGAP